MSQQAESQTSDNFDPATIQRPVEALARYYGLLALLSGPFFPIAFAPMYFKYITLRYKFDESGVSMSWGIFFKREIHLTYRRIQDIHLTRNLVQRWMGLATVAIQTASGSAGPEMSIEGVLEADELRDYLYRQMRGARGETEATSQDSAQDETADASLALLREIRDLLKDRPLSERSSA